MLLNIKTKPNSVKNEIGFDGNGKIVVRITAVPVDGKANKHLEKYIASVFDLPASRVKIIKGFANPNKVIEVQSDESIITMILNKIKEKSASL